MIVTSNNSNGNSLVAICPLEKISCRIDIHIYFFGSSFIAFSMTIINNLDRGLRVVIILGKGVREGGTYGV